MQGMQSLPAPFSFVSNTDAVYEGDYSPSKEVMKAHYEMLS
jgi:hypothetical protein